MERWKPWALPNPSCRPMRSILLTKSLDYQYPRIFSPSIFGVGNGDDGDTHHPRPSPLCHFILSDRRHKQLSISSVSHRLLLDTSMPPSSVKQFRNPLPTPAVIPHLNENPWHPEFKTELPIRPVSGRKAASLWHREESRAVRT